MCDFPDLESALTAMARNSRMTTDERYTMHVEHVNQQERDLLECLLRIDQREALDERANGLCQRLIEAGLVDPTLDGLRLTRAGIERCQSLQHHLACDREAARALATRDMAHAMTSSEDSHAE